MGNTSLTLLVKVRRECLSNDIVSIEITLLLSLLKDVDWEMMLGRFTFIDVSLLSSFTATRLLKRNKL